MANTFFVYDSNGNITTAKTSYPVDSDIFPGAQILVMDVSAQYVQQAFSNPSNFMVSNGQLIPAVTILLNRTQQVQGREVIWTLNLNTSDGNPRNVTLSYLGHSETLFIPVGGVQRQISVHQSVNAYHVPIRITGQGVIPLDSFIGGSVTNGDALQVYSPDGVAQHIAPVYRKTLLAYYSAQVSPDTVIPDLATSDGMLMQAVFGIILPAMLQQNPNLLDANQQNALQDIRLNVLPSILTTLETATPAPVTTSSNPQFDLHYASYRRHVSTTYKAFNDYAADVVTIPNLIG